MPTQPYHLADGTRVPGTTTIIGRFKESGALIGWAMKRTRELDLAALKAVPEDKFTLLNACLAISLAKTPRQQAREEADAGTICHQWIDDTAYGRELAEAPELATNEMVAMATKGLEAFKRWWDLHQFSVISSETPLVSEKYRYGGTRDMLAEDRHGILCALDWKCANAIYPNQYVPQLAAYSNLAKENGEGVIERHHLFRSGKQDASGHHHDWSDATVAKGWELFKIFRRAYDLSNELAKL